MLVSFGPGGIRQITIFWLKVFWEMAYCKEVPFPVRLMDVP